MEIYLSSETLGPDQLSETEHWSNRIEAAREYFGFKEKRNSPPKGTGYGIEHGIQEWFNDETPRDALARPLDIFYVKNENPDKSFWIPWIEHKLVKEFQKSSYEIYNFTLGYIDGRAHHLGKFKSNGMTSASLYRGYQIWMEAVPVGDNTTVTTKED